MREEAQFRPSELLALYRADCLALIVILERHKNRLTPLEHATLAALEREHRQDHTLRLRLRGRD